MSISKNSKLLIVTQAVDLDNPVLGFFHRWIEELALRFDSIVVICLFEGRHNLPRNVEVFSLGKEKKEAYKAQYTQRFLALVWGLRNTYDSVFVHMNQEYVLVAGWLWKLLGKRVYLWRNHYQPNVLIRIAAFFCTKMFCTSKYSYVTKYAKTILMPIGIDTETFKPTTHTSRKGSVLSLGRIAPSKHVEVLIEAFAILAGRGVSVNLDIYGSSSIKDSDYRDSLVECVKERGLDSSVQFHAGVSNIQAPEIYRSHEICVNCSASGMYYKTIFEAAACGALSIASSRDYAAIAPPELVFREGDAADLAAKIEYILALQTLERERLRKEGSSIVEKNSLRALGQRIVEEVH